MISETSGFSNLVISIWSGPPLGSLVQKSGSFIPSERVFIQCFRTFVLVNLVPHIPAKIVVPWRGWSRIKWKSCNIGAKVILTKVHTGWKSRGGGGGGGVPDVFCQNPQGGSRLSEKIARGSPYFGFYCIFIHKFFKNLSGGGVLFHPPSPLIPSVYIYAF
jgi:hypothetical protein